MPAINPIVSQLMVAYQDTGRPLFAEAAKEITRLQGLIPPENIDEAFRYVIPISVIKKVACDEFRLPPGLLSHRTRRKEIVEFRMVVIALCRKLTSATYKTLAKEFRRSPASLNHLDTRSVIRERVDFDYADMLARLCSKCREEALK